MITIKNERGITLIAVVLTIVIMLILTTITVKTGIGSIEESRMISFVSKMQLLQKKVDFLAENGGYEELGQGLGILSAEKINSLKTIMENEKIDVAKLRVLPSEYQEIEYIQLDETTPYETFITTGIQLKNISSIEFKYSCSNTVSHNPMVFSCYTTSSTSSTTPYICANGSVSGSWSISPPTTEETIINTPTEYKITNSDTSTNLLKIGGWNDSYWTAVGRYYYVKIYDKSNQLIFDYVPCYKISDNTIGMFDLVNDEFFTSAGTSDFDKGPNVENSTIKFFNSATIANDLGIDNIDDEIIVDFATRQIVSLNGIEYEGKMHYSQYNLPGGQKVKQGEEEVRQLDNVSVTPTINGLNATWTISGIEHTNGTLSYSRDNKKTWTQITNYTIAGEDVTTENITQSGTYYFKWTDNTNKNNEYLLDVVQLRLVNSPQLRGDLEDLSEKYNYSSLDSATWAYATDKKGTPDDLTDDEVYVWIPRFAYEENNTTNIEFLRGTSNVTTSENYLPETGWIIPEPLKDVTGVWAHIPDLEPLKSGLDIIDILKNTNLTIYNAE